MMARQFAWATKRIMWSNNIVKQFHDAARSIQKLIRLRKLRHHRCATRIQALWKGWHYRMTVIMARRDELRRIALVSGRIVCVWPLLGCRAEITVVVRSPGGARSSSTGNFRLQATQSHGEIHDGLVCHYQGTYVGYCFSSVVRDEWSHFLLVFRCSFVFGGRNGRFTTAKKPRKH
jgi:hypothetical protein